MVGHDVRKTSRRETKHHRVRLVDSVPADTRSQPADRIKAGDGIYLDCASSMKAWALRTAPTATAWLKQNRTGDAQGRVPVEFSEQLLKHRRSKAQICIQAKNKVIASHAFRFEELRDCGLAAGRALTLSREVVDRNPGMFPARLIKNCCSIID